MRCYEIEDYLQDYLDHELPYSLRESIEEHLANCNSCREAVESYRKLKVLLHLRSVPDPGDSYWESTWRAIRQRLPARIAALTSQNVSNGRAPAGGRSRRSTVLGYVAAAAMVLVVLSSFLFWEQRREATVVMDYVSEYVLTLDEKTDQEILVRRAIPSDLQPDVTFAAYTRAAFGGFDPVSKGMGLVMVEASDK